MSTAFEAFTVDAGPLRRHGVALIPLGMALSIFLSLSFLLCALAALIPGVREIHVLRAVYPAFDWSRPDLIAFGATAAFGCGWWAALVAGGLYNLFSSRRV